MNEPKSVGSIGMRPRLVEGEIVPSAFGAQCQVRCETLNADGVCMAMPWSADLANTDRSIHGGAIATLADISATAAVWNDQKIPANTTSVVTITLSLGYLSPARGILYAAAQAQGGGRKLRHVRVEMQSADGIPVAWADAVMRIVTRDGPGTMRVGSASE